MKWKEWSTFLTLIHVLRGVLIEHGFRFLAAVGEDIDKFIEDKTRVVFAVQLKGAVIHVQASSQIPINPNMDNKRRVLSHLNKIVPLGVFSTFTDESINEEIFVSRHVFLVYEDPLGYDSGWFALTVKRLCDSHAWILANFVNLLSKPVLA
jgi:hypothetical protein